MNHTTSFIVDPIVQKAMDNELKRQQDCIELIASENFVSQAVLKAQGSILTNKYAEGYPANRYYGGCEYVDIVENLAIDRLKNLFDCQFANVQPHSGSQANQAVCLALLKPGDTILGMSLDAGGHLTHGSSVNLSGKWFNAVSYGVLPQTHLIDYDQVRQMALTHKPKLIIAGGSAYPRAIDFKKFREIANEVGAYFQVDMAHFAGLVAANILENPLNYADVVTSTTHKTLRGPRGGIVLTNDSTIAKKIDFAVFPGLQGGPLMHVIAAKAVAFGEALTPAFKEYSAQVVANAKQMEKTLTDNNIDLVTGGTDCHLLLLDLRKQGLTGKIVQEALEEALITCNKNSVPADPMPPKVTSGIRIGTPAITSRGFGLNESQMIAQFIADLINGLVGNANELQNIKDRVKNETLQLLKKFPIYPNL